MNQIRTFSKELVIGWIVTQVFKITYCLFGWIIRLYFNVECKVPREILELSKKRFLIVANHKSLIDPYLIFATLPIKILLLLSPVRFFTANIYLKYFWQQLLLIPFGCFRAYSDKKYKISGVKGGLELSDIGQSLFIFPQGKRVEDLRLIKPKIGIAYLIKHRDFTVIPVLIDCNKVLITKKTRIVWGKPFRINKTQKTKNLVELSQLIFDKVIQLSK